MMNKLIANFILILTGCLFPTPVETAVAASIVMKMQVKNPSKSEGQTVPLKVYLPKEISPKDIIDLGDLKLDYDPDTGMYYVHNSVDLEPGQSMTKRIEMKDVWVFTEDQMSAFVDQAKEMAKQLEGSPYAAEALALVVGIEERVQGILKRQEETADQPSEHIRAYRQGLSLLNTIRQDVSALKTLRQDSGGEALNNKQAASASLSGNEGSDGRMTLPGSGGVAEGGAPLGRSISMTAAWRIIFAILGFLGILSVVFFMTWHRLLRTTMKYEQGAVPLDSGEQLEGGGDPVLGPRPE